MQAKQKEGRLGILAGHGELPWIAATNAQEAGEDVRIFYPKGVEVPNAFVDISCEITVTRLYTSVLAALKADNITRLLLLGKFTRELLYNHSGFDLRTLWLLARSWSQSDYALFQISNQLFKRNHIEVIDQRNYLKSIALKEGRYGKRLSKREIKDVLFGLHHVRVLSQLDIGQTLVVGDCAILALEAAEGSDSCIQRGGNLFAPKRGAVVCKVAREAHDIRFDIPTIGSYTLEKMNSVQCRVLAIDATCSIIVDPVKFTQLAKKYQISIVVLNPKIANFSYLKKLNLKARKAKVD